MANARFVAWLFTADKGAQMISKLKTAANIVLIAAVIPVIAAALYPVESWITGYLYLRFEISTFEYGALRFLEMALFALATFVLAHEAISPKRWSIATLGIGFVISALLLSQAESLPLFTDFDILRAFLTTAYGVTFLLALSGKVSA